MSNPVAAYAQELKNFSRTTSLRTWVGIAAGAVMTLGYQIFWTRVFVNINLEMDAEFNSSLSARDRKKGKKRIRQKSKEGKSTRRKTDLEKHGQYHREQMDDLRTGKMYGSGVALATAKKAAKAKLTSAARNPKGTPKDQLRCPYYHPLFCSKRGHTSAASPFCGQKSVSKEQRMANLAIIENMKIEELLLVQGNGKSNTYASLYCIFLDKVMIFVSLYDLGF